MLMESLRKYHDQGMGVRTAVAAEVMPLGAPFPGTYVGPFWIAPITTFASEPPTFTTDDGLVKIQRQLTQWLQASGDTIF